MKPSEVEEWTLRILEAHSRGQPTEDSRYELKQSWIDPYKAARRLEGHANAARGEVILWIIGATESGKVIPIEPNELADWWPQVSGHFSPPILEAQPTTVFTPDPVVAILFETSRAPYLVKNPRYGERGGGPIELEVPWREMTAVRSARHSDLIRILMPQSRLPIAEVISGTLSVQGRFDSGFGKPTPAVVGDTCQWELQLSPYLVPRSSGVLVFPAHKIHIEVRCPALGEAEFKPYTLTRGGGTGALLVTRQPDIILQHAERIELSAKCSAPLVAEPEKESQCEISLLPAEGEIPLKLGCALELRGPRSYVLRGDAES